jgi:cell division protein FtsN
MAKNATRRRNSARKNSSSHQDTGSASSISTFWILLGVAVGILMTFGFLQWQKQQINAKPVKPVVAKTAVPDIHFDFYQILPNIKPKAFSSNAENSLVNKPSAENSSIAPPPNPNTNFMIQIASVKSYADADRLRAELSLLGYDVSVRNAKTNNEQSYQILIGPYPSLESAKAVQKRLQNDKIQSVLLKAPGL